MDERVLTRGLVCAVWFNSANTEVHVGSWFIVSDAEADKALAAKRAGKEIEIVQPEGGCWKNRTVRLVPVVVVKARGLITALDWHSNYTGKGEWKDSHTGNVAHLRLCPVGAFAWSTWFPVTNAKDAARAYADDAEVEIVSIDGGPDMVRRVS